MNRVLKRTITGVRGIPRNVEIQYNYNKYPKQRGAFIFLHKTRDSTLCKQSNQWFDYFSRKNYSNSLHFFDVCDCLHPFGVVFNDSSHWLFYEKKALDEKIKDIFN